MFVITCDGYHVSGADRACCARINRGLCRMGNGCYGGYYIEAEDTGLLVERG